MTRSGAWSLLILIALAFSGQAEEVTLDTGTGMLHGTLEAPPAAMAIPVVLLISGSGPTDRDGNSFLLAGRNDSLKLLAQSLASLGIATLRYDKRGVGASIDAAPSETALRFEIYVQDAVAWAQQLRLDGRFSTVSIAGHSEGSLIAILAAGAFPVDRVISIAGAGRPAGQLLLSQLEGQLSTELMMLARQIVASLEAGRLFSNPPGELSVLFRSSVQPYLISWFRYDPAVEMARLTIPILVIQGTTDIQIGIDDSTRLAAANSFARLILIEGMNHVLKNVSADADEQERSYIDPTLPIHPTLVNAVSGFVSPRPRRRAVGR